MNWDRFTLEIALGNDAMQSAGDIARALRAVARKLEDGRTEGKVMDENGNGCGRWEVA